MAKSKLLTRRGPKKPVSKSRTQKRVIDEKAYGSEEPPIPDFSKSSALGDYIRCLTWYGRMSHWYFEPKEWVVTYLKSVGREDDALRMKRVPEKWISSTLMAQARLIERGTVLPSGSMEVMEQFIQDALSHENAVVDDSPSEDSEDDDDTEKKPVIIEKPTIQDHIKEKTSDIIGELEGLIDDGFYDGFQIDVWYREKKANPMIVKKIIDKLTPVRDELEEAIRGKDDQLKEGYSYLSKSDLKAWASLYTTLIEDSERFISNVKAAKPARAKKAPSVEKKIKRMAESYLKYSKEFNVTSTDPAKIIGAQEVWLFNAKYKLLTVFRAESMGGQLDVNGRKVIGFDKNASFSKSIGRKTPEWLDRVIRGSRPQLKKLMDEIKSNPISHQEVVNENVVVLKVY